MDEIVEGGAKVEWNDIAGQEVTFVVWFSDFDYILHLMWLVQYF